MDSVHEMLVDIYQWFSENLKHSKPASATRPPSGGSRSRAESEAVIIFSVYTDMSDGAQPTLLCPRASFHPEWLKARDHINRRRLLQCCCQPRNNHDETASAYSEIHERQLQFSCETNSYILHVPDGLAIYGAETS